MIKILYIEDDEDDSELVKGLLWMSCIDIDLVIASTGQMGLTILNNLIKRTQQLPSVILLDLGLTDYSGIQLFDIIRSTYKLTRIPVAVLSASSRPADINYFLIKPGVKYYTKPGTELGYKRILDEILDGCV